MRVFKEIEPIITALDYSAFTFRMPKSRLLFLIVNISGEVPEDSFRNESHYLLNYVETIQANDYHFSNIILNFQALNYGASGLSYLLPKSHYEISKHVGIIGNKGSEDIGSGYLSFTNLDDALSEFCFFNRNFRFDGGKKETQPIPVSNLYNFVSKFETEKPQVEVSYLNWKFQQKQLYLVKVSGYYPPGSQGAFEGKFISYKLRELIRSYSPDGVVIDFSGLDYQWGDEIEVYPFEFKREDRPFQLVLKPEQYESFSFKLKKTEIRISDNIERACDKLERMFL